MNTPPTPALVTQRAVARLPRLALLLFCAAYVLPGLFGRDPWRNADVTSFGYMASVARGASPWWAPALGGLPSDGALLPYALGAAFIKVFGPLFGAPFAARMPFALMLVGVLIGLWYSCYYLARTEAAQPAAFAFGGEAHPIDYARAIADGALLALIASLGLLQLGHETTPELAQLFGATLFLYAMAVSPWHTRRSRSTMLVALPLVAASGAPAVAVGLALAGTVISLRSSYERARGFVPWVVAAGVLAAVIGWLTDTWAWRLQAPRGGGQLLQLLVWFAWPAWALAAWTLWRWRSHLMHRHISVPAATAAVGVVASIAMGGSDRALLLALPPLAVLAAFALPTLQRSVAAAMDWFSVFFFSLGAVWVWVIYVSLHTGVPAKPAANIARLAPGFLNRFEWAPFATALAGTVAWALLVRWRTGRHRHPLWKSLVLPAGGVALGWLLAMTLLMPPLDYARSYRPLIERIAQHVPRDACVAAPQQDRGFIAALEVHGGWRVEAAGDSGRCEFLLAEVPIRSAALREGWQLVARERRPTDRVDDIAIYRRAAAAAQ